MAIALALLAIYLIWGSTYLGISVAVKSIPPFLMAGMRFTIAGGLMFFFLRRRGHAAPTRAQWGGALLVGGLLVVGCNGLVSYAEQWVPSGLAALMAATTPLWAALFAGLWGQWPARVEWVGLAVGFAGVALLNLEGGLRANPLGALALVIAALSWALGSVWSRRLTMPNGIMSSAAQMLTAGVVLTSIGLLTGERLQAVPSVESLAAMLYLIVFGSLIAYTAYGFLLRNVRPSLATSYAYVNPAVAVVLGIGLAGERIDWVGVAAMLVILAGVGAMALGRGKSKPGGVARGERDGGSRWKSA
jgi:drug/metabolite transporter (DMT)-like permease